MQIQVILRRVDTWQKGVCNFIILLTTQISVSQSIGEYYSFFLSETYILPNINIKNENIPKFVNLSVCEF